jgi:ABC-type dipeptide/oligopeptide/nickel transport system permease subunit
MRRNYLFWGSVIYLILLVVFALIGPTFRHNYDVQVGLPHQPPSAEFWLGTDEQGRDIVARLAQGARASLEIGFTVQGVALLLGITLGVLGVFAPKWIREPLMRFTDGMFAFPDLLLAFLIIGVWNTETDSGIIPVVVALSVTAWPHIARLVKNQVESIKEREFVVAAKALGASTSYIVTRHILPQLWSILLAVAIVDLAGIILAESTLSFLGIGIRPPEPSWGNMIDNGRADMNSHPLVLVWPCAILSFTIFALNFVGEGIRTMLDPKSRLTQEEAGGLLGFLKKTPNVQASVQES